MNLGKTLKTTMNGVWDVGKEMRAAAASTPKTATSGGKSGGSGGGGGTTVYAPQQPAKKNPYANPSATESTGLYGVTPGTQAAMYKDYTPSQAVLDAQNYLNTLRQNAPGEYVDPYADQLQQLYQSITSRPKFNYDLNGDMLYKQLAQQYQMQGRNAMQDTMGQAAALTGGYGSSYATTAGNQAYQGYLQQLNDRVPELYRLALDTYLAEGDQLNQQYGMLRDFSDTDYGRYQDAVSRYYNDLGLATDRYNNERSFDYGTYNDARNYAYQMAGLEMDNARQDQQYARNLAMTMLKAGQRPSNAVLAAAGLDNYDTWQLYQYAKSGGKF